jgi:hypothetical protein
LTADPVGFGRGGSGCQPSVPAGGNELRGEPHAEIVKQVDYPDRLAEAAGRLNCTK